MKRILGARQIVRFALLATPAIWVTLFAIEQSTEPVPMYTYNLASILASTTDCYGCRDEPQTSLIDTLLPVAEGFKSNAISSSVSREDKLDKARHIHSRRTVHMVLPRGLTRDEIDANLREAARYQFEDGAISVQVIARVLDGRNMVSAHSVATLTFAPYGDWDRTDYIHELEEYKTVIYHRAPFQGCNWK